MANKCLCVLTLFLLLFSCKKEADNSIPVITVNQPGNLQQFTVGDSIPVSAQITDEREIRIVQVSLVDESFKAVTPTQLFYPNAVSYQLSTQIPISDTQLESGNYYVFIKADNGGDFKNKYQQVIVNGFDQEFVQSIVITEGGFNQLNVYGTADFDAFGLLETFPGDFSASAISSKDDLLFVAGKNNSNVSAYNLELDEIAWVLEVTPGQPIHNAGCLDFNEFLYTTYNYDFIHGYTPSGGIGFDVSIDEFDAPERIYRFESFVLTEVQKKNSIDPYIVTFFALTGDEKQRRFINFDVINFHTKDKETVIITGNKGEQGVVYSYNLTNDVLTFLLDIPDKINASVQTNTNALALAGPSGIYSYSMVYGNAIKILNSGAKILAYEHLSSSLITGKFQELVLYSYPEMVNQKTLLFSDTILDIQIQYSK